MWWFTPSSSLTHHLQQRQGPEPIFQQGLPPLGSAVQAVLLLLVPLPRWQAGRRQEAPSRLMLAATGSRRRWRSGWCWWTLRLGCCSWRRLSLAAVPAVPHQMVLPLAVPHLRPRLRLMRTPRALASVHCPTAVLLSEQAQATV